MAARGPVPKPAAQRRRTNKKPEPVKKAVRKSAPVEKPTRSKKTVEVAAPKIPVADKTWHPIAASIYNSLADSGQSEFYEASDWATAFLACESISRDLSPQVVGVTIDGRVVKDVIPMKGASLSAYLKAFTSLLMTEGDRRRASIELQRGPQLDPDAERADATVTAIGLRLASA